MYRAIYLDLTYFFLAKSRSLVSKYLLISSQAEAPSWIMTASTGAAQKII